MARSDVDAKRLHVQRHAGCVALPLLLVSGWLLLTGRGPDDLGMALLVAASVVMLSGVLIAVWRYPKDSSVK